MPKKSPVRTTFGPPTSPLFNGKYHLYYSVSTFGQNRSLIGLATNATLDPRAEGFGWVDEGLVLESFPSDDYNAIDPNLVLDAGGEPWLAFGSFWSGIKLVKLEAETGKPASETPELHALATRSVNSRSVEAPFIFYRDGFYYLFVSFDFCCRGADSTYNVRVGRATEITGPYVDRDGVPLLNGGGTQVTFPTERWRGPGHNAVFAEGDTVYIVYHAYDADNAGVSVLRIAPLQWDAEGWPSAEPG